ncbi:MAG: hypothetical protein ACRD3J_05725, partial [Thermoanaerobaculia bacterium]
DDFMTDGLPSFNGFSRRCPTPEGVLAAAPFTAGEYVPIALVNRFDQAPAGGANCGQFRLIFARKLTFQKKLHIIIEPVLRNPYPSAGLAGCRAVAQFWAGLTNVDSTAERRAKLESFYFDGLPGFPPVLDPAQVAPGSGGGIRTTQIVGDGIPRMYQFRLTKDCSDACTLRMTPDTLQNFPFAPLFDASRTFPGSQAFQDVFIQQIPNLAVHDLNEYFMDIPRDFLIAESAPLDSTNFPGSFNHGKDAGFRDRVQDKLTSIGSTLTPEQIVLRADTQSCIGCHFAAGPVATAWSSLALWTTPSTSLKIFWRPTSWDSRDTRSHEPCSMSSSPIG